MRASWLAYTIRFARRFHRQQRQVCAFQGNQFFERLQQLAIFQPGKIGRQHHLPNGPDGCVDRHHQYVGSQLPNQGRSAIPKQGIGPIFFRTDDDPIVGFSADGLRSHLQQRTWMR